ncbi:MAG TPA: CvpA family protein [Bryobacteraceae bacterium]|nr:CvpA family protein [Bryobacteraceae bacterium]
MNWLDILLLLIVVVSIITSFKKGFSRQVIHLAAVVAGILLGAWFYPRVAEYLQPHLNSPTAARLAGFFIIFGAVLMLGAVVSSTVGRFLRVTGLSFVDHILGAGLGVLQGVLISAALLMGVMAFSKEGHPPQSIEESRVAPYVSQATRVFVAMAPAELKEGFHKSYGQARDFWQRNVKSTHPAPEADRK